MKNMNTGRLVIAGITLAAIANPLWSFADSSFTGHAYEVNTGLVDNRARSYDPEIGQFINKDPSSIDGGLNLYQYCYSNPVNLVDQTGRNPAIIVAGGIVAYLLLSNAEVANAPGPGDPVYPAKGPVPMVADAAAMATGGVIGKAVAPYIAKPLLSVASRFLPGSAATIATAGGKTLSANLAQVTYSETFSFTGAKVVGAKTIDAGARAIAQGARPVVEYIETGAEKALISNTRTFQAYARAGVEPAFELGTASTAERVVGQLARNTLSSAGTLFAVSEATIGTVGFGLGVFGGASASAFGLQSFDQAGVLIDKAATLVGSNLADIKGATYDPVSNQILFLGSNSSPGVEGINMDYFFTAVNAVYGSAVPPFVSLDAPVSATTLWTDFGDGDGSFEPGEWGGFTMRYNPLWSDEDSTVGVKVRCRIGATAYDFTVNFTPETIDWVVYPNGQFPMHLVYAGITGTAPPGVSVWTGPFPNLPYPQTVLNYVNTSTNANGGQDWTYPFQLYNGGTGMITNVTMAVLPDRQHRRFGGRLESTKLGWVLQEADRIMKCLAIGKDNVTGATYSSATVPITGYKNLAEINQAGTSVSGNTRLWFLAEEMALKRHVDAADGRATIVFDRAIVGVKTESFLLAEPQSPGVAAFATHLQTNYDAFAARTYPVISPDDPSGQTVVNLKIFKMLKDAMQAVSLARFFRDNNIPLDMWWMNSWKAPTAYSLRSVPTIANDTLGIFLYGGVQARKLNTYSPSTSAQSVGTSVASARPNAATNPSEDLKQQAWTASTTEGTLKAVATSVTSGQSQGIVNLAETDLSFASPGALPLEFTRYYQSGHVGNSVLGPGWRTGRYVLEFERPSWFDENNMMKYFGNQLVPRDEKSDTRLRSGAVRLVDLSTGATLDFYSSFSVAYYLNASGNPAVSLAGLTAEEVPVFTSGTRKDGTILVQNDDGVRGYSAYLPDGSVLVFDAEGRLEISQDRHAYAQWYFRDSQSRVYTIQDSANRTLTLAYNPTTGKLASVTGPQSERTNYNYDASGRLQNVVHQRSSAVIAQYTYNTDNQLIDVKRMDGTKLVTTAPDSKGRSDERMDRRSNNFDFAYFQNATTGVKTTEVQDDASVLAPSQQNADAQGRTTSVGDPLGNYVGFGYTGASMLPNSVQLPTAGRPAITIGRNASGQPTSISDPAVQGAVPMGLTYNNANRVTRVTDEAGRAIEADYTTGQDLQKVRRFLGTTPVEVTYGYLNGYLNTVKDPLNKTWTMGRDAYGRVTSVKDPTNVTLGMEYDSLGRLWRVTDPRLSSPITYTFDSLDRVETVTTPAGVTRYTYDPVTKWLKTMTDVENRVVTFTHNAANGDVTKASYAMPLPGGGTTPLDTDYTYARFGDLATVTAPGSQPISFQVDDLGRVGGTTEAEGGLFDAPRGFVSNNAINGTWTKQNNHVFTWGAPESSSPVNGYSFAQDATPGQTVTTTAPSATWNAVADGQHTAQVRAKNTNGFWSPAAIFNLRVDSVAPAITGVNSGPNPVPQSPGTVTISATVSDALSGLASGNPQLRWCISADASRPWSAYSSMTSAGGNQWTKFITQNGAQATGQVFYFEIQAQDLATNSAVTGGSLPMTYTGGGAGVRVMPIGWLLFLALLILATANRFLPRKESQPA